MSTLYWRPDDTTSTHGYPFVPGCILRPYPPPPPTLWLDSIAVRQLVTRRLEQERESPNVL